MYIYVSGISFVKHFVDDDCEVLVQERFTLNISTVWDVFDVGSLSIGICTFWDFGRRLVVGVGYRKCVEFRLLEVMDCVIEN